MDDIERCECSACGCDALECDAEFGRLREHYVGQANNREAEITRLGAQLAGAVEALETILAASDTSKPIEVPINRLAGVHEEARLALLRHRGR